MPAIFKKQVVLVWGALVLATLIAWVIGLEHGFAGRDGAKIGLAAVLLIAFIKVHVVGRYFMELRTAPLGLRLAFGGWVVGVGAMVIGLYLMG